MFDAEDKFNNFDWELYLTNYPDLKSLYDNKDKAWWHFTNIGKNEDFIYFDVRNRDDYFTNRDNFDWELYLTNYPDLKTHFDDKHKAWWHFINIGKKKDFIYFDIRNRNEYFTNRDNFDWELYLMNYPDLKTHFDDKHKAWWHFINVGKKKDFIYFDLHKHDEYFTKRDNFDWELYLTNYPDLKTHFDNKDKAWWHFINIGKKQDFIYFDIHKRVEYFANRDNFDWNLYLTNYPDLKSQYGTKDKAWNHFINIGEKKGYSYFCSKDKFKQLLKKKSLFYYVGTTCYQEFNTGIQRVTRNLSNIIGNYFKEYNFFLIMYDDKKNDLRLLNETEMSVFCKYNGYNQNENTSISEKIEIFELIKKNGKNITILIPELLHCHQYNILNKIIETSQKNNYQTVHIYHDDSIYNNVEIPEYFRKDNFDTYMKIVSKVDIILPNSNYSKSTYLFHKNRLRITTNQKIKTLLLSGELLNIKRVINKDIFTPLCSSNAQTGRSSLVKHLLQTGGSNYIFANISITKRKNVERLIQSFNLLNCDFPDLKLIICGVVYQENDYYDSFKKILTPNIIFEKNKTDVEIGNLYKNALFSVYPSIEEGFGLPIYESLWYCTPVICHNGTSTQEIASEINSECVVSVDCTNEKSLYLQMKKWMDSEYLKKICSVIKNIRIKTWYEYTDEIIRSISKNKIVNDKIIIYYYVHHTSSCNIRTGIQNYTIYLAKQFIKKNKQIIFVKWDENINSLVPCNHKEINHLFNYNETDDIIEEIHYDDNNFKAIHLTNKEKKKSVFFNPEYTTPKFASNINGYLLKNSIKSVHILHDIIPLVLDSYSDGRERFNTYFVNSILTSDKIITVSNFSKMEFYDYCKKKIPNLKNNLPIIKSILLPYQYRNKERLINPENKNKKISILLPGSIEDRKQQLTFMRLFNKFITLNPKIDVELITFGHIFLTNKEDIFEEIKKSNNQIKYLGIINNDKLFELYKSASFSCYISYYEGFGLPISESLWHGTPVLTSNFGSMYEVSKEGGCYCIDTTSENEIYEAIEKLVKTPEILVKLKKEIACANFTTWENYADSVYNEIMLDNFIPTNV